MGRNKKEEENDNEDEAEEVLEEGDEAPWSAVPARWGRAAPAVPTTTNYTTDGSRAHPGRWSRHRGLLRPGGARGVETPPRYLYSAPSADPALRLEGRGVATGTGGNREGRGEEEEEEEEEDEGQEAGLFPADRRAIAVCSGPVVRGGVKTAPRYLYSAPSADPALCLEGRGRGATGRGGKREG